MAGLLKSFCLSSFDVKSVAGKSNISKLIFSELRYYLFYNIFSSLFVFSDCTQRASGEGYGSERRQMAVS